MRIIVLLFLFSSISLSGSANGADAPSRPVDFKKCIELIKEGTMDVNQKLVFIGINWDSVRQLVVCSDEVFNATPLHEAAHVGDNEIIKFLVERGALVNCTNNCRRTALHSAAMNGHLSSIELLKGFGADESVVSHSSKTAEELYQDWCKRHRGFGIKAAKR